MMIHGMMINVRRMVQRPHDGFRRPREADSDPFPTALDPSIDPMILSRWLCAVPYVKALRLHHWSKNLLVLLPVVAAHNLTPKVWIAALLAFVSFSFVASSAYLLNDLLDLAADRAHPRKRNRPLASGALPRGHAMVMTPALLLLGGGFALAVGRWQFVATMLAYYVATAVYSLYLKHKLAIDICTLAGLYALRIVAGGAATGIELSEWLLAFSIFFSMSLAAIKRQAELVDGAASGREQALGRAYSVGDLPIISMVAVAAGYVSILVLALYVNSDSVRSLYSEPRLLWAVCPVLLYWLTRIVIVAERGRMGDDPILFAFRDLASYICGLLILGAIVAGSLL
jgi:4-hydroxybenzoate polyprenyltransferase